MSFDRFEGWYFKHQTKDKTVSLIPGYAQGEAFIQVITNEASFYFSVPEIILGKRIHAGASSFGAGGIKIALPGIAGEILYGPFTRLSSDIMGPFRFFPMECKHSIISMRHALTGFLRIKGENILFDGGIGYLEKDSGRSFPKEYLWIQCNDFCVDCSIMLSIAQIPFGPLCFPGCICAIVYKGREYRLATYQGVKLLSERPESIRLLQGNYLLEVNVLQTEEGKPLRSPLRGKMTGLVRETNHAAARFRFWDGKKQIFDLTSCNASFECFK